MKNILKASFLCLALTIGFTSCSTWEEMNTNRYGVTSEMLEIDFNNIGAYFPRLMQSVYYNYGDAAWNMQIMTNLTCDQWVGYMGTTTAFSTSTSNLMYNDGWTSCMWSETYNHVMSPLAIAIKPQADNDDYYYFYAPALVIKVLAMARVCDYYGPIIYSQYGTGDLDPKFDSVQEAYNGFFADLDSAMEKLDKYITQYPGAKPFEKFDEWCGGDFVNWCKLINSARLRLALHIVKVDPTLAKAQAEKAGANKYGFLEEFDVMEQGDSWSHPLQMITDWGDTSMGATIESFITGYEDPRGAKWFTETTDANALAAGRKFMSIRSGIDPETHDKTKYAGISWYGMGKKAPGYIFSSAEAYFLRAEGALRGWANMGGSPKDLYESGVKASFKYWGVSGAEDYLKSEKVPADYVDFANPAISAKAANTLCPKWDDSASNEIKLERIVDQKFIAMWPDGLEAWTTLRRTGYPKQLPVVYNGNPSVFKNDDVVRRLMFPATLQKSNPQGYASAVSALGGADAGNTRLWWDKDVPNF